MARGTRSAGVVDLTEDDDAQQEQSSRRTRLHTRNHDQIRAVPVIVYPPGERDTVTLTMGDIERLNPGEFLNDSLVDFHCRWITKQMQPSVAKRIHIFSSFLHAKLAQDLPKADREAAAVKWSKGVDVFEKDYILIPICQKLHWSLAVVCFPRLESENLEVSESFAAGETHEGFQVPCILHFNSIRRNHPVIFQRIRGYLQHFWDVRHKASRGERNLVSPSSLRGYNPHCPQQTNEWDCGIYVLEFIKRLCLESPDPTIEDLRKMQDKKSFFDRRAWFKPIDLERARDEFRELVDNMQENLMQQQLEQHKPSSSAADGASAAAGKRARKQEDDEEECVEVQVVDSQSLSQACDTSGAGPAASPSPPPKRHRLLSPGEAAAGRAVHGAGGGSRSEEEEVEEESQASRRAAEESLLEEDPSVSAEEEKRRQQVAADRRMAEELQGQDEVMAEMEAREAALNARAAELEASWGGPAEAPPPRQGTGSAAGPGNLNAVGPAGRGEDEPVDLSDEESDGGVRCEGEGREGAVRVNNDDEGERGRGGGAGGGGGASGLRRARATAALGGQQSCTAL